MRKKWTKSVIKKLIIVNAALPTKINKLGL